MEIETKCLHSGYEPKNGESRMIPIIQGSEEGVTDTGLGSYHETFPWWRCP